MISSTVVFTIVAFQLLLIIGVVWWLVATHGRNRRYDQADSHAMDLIREPLHAFLVKGQSSEALAAAFAKLPPSVAARQMQALGGSLLAEEQMRELAARVRNDAWVVETLEQGTSRRWWKRMEAARLLAMVCSKWDQPLLARLVMDPHPAVAAAATASIGRHAERELIEEVVRRIPALPPTARLQQMHGLRRHSEIVTPLVVAALGETLPAEDLQVMVRFGEILGTPAALAAIVKLAMHPDGPVRASVARALRAAYVPGAAEAALELLKDPDWRVRAAAARALEGLKVTAAVPALSAALRDPQWWVRFRAAVALSGLGERGRTALEEAVVGDDNFARQMAIHVGSLSEANRLDMGG